MSTFSYTIKSFDAKTNVLDVAFDDGSARIQLRTPLPTNKTELEAIIKTYTAPLEAVEARTADVDLSYISALVDVRQTCDRFSFRKKAAEQEAEANASIDPAVEAVLIQAEKDAFKSRIREILVEFNLLPGGNHE